MPDSVRVQSQSQGPIVLYSNAQGLHVEVADKPKVTFPWWNVLWAEYAHDQLRVHALPVSDGKSSRRLQTFRGAPKSEDAQAVEEWARQAQTLAYPNSSPARRLKIFVNPIGGKGKAVKTFETKVKPIFDAAQCSQDILYTQRSKHAYDVAASMSLQDIDVVVTVSGDGLLHEIVNGFADRPEMKDALKIPICPVPCGSANGLCVSLLGLKDSFDVVEAALNAIKGQPMRIDLCSVLQDGKKTWSFMMQAMGMMAELDLGTEHLRWMGDARFTYGYIRGVIANKTCPIRLELKDAIMDKERLLSDWNATSGQAEANGTRHGGEEPSWVAFDEPWIYCVAGKVPYVARALMQFPLARPTDGLIDIVIQGKTKRGEMIKSVDDGPSGQFFFTESIHYAKARGYKITPLGSSGVLAVDGERLPFKPYEVEVHQALGCIMSPTGHYVQDFAGSRTKGEKSG